MSTEYYVYEHIRKDNNTVIYVGKGHGKRAWEKKRNKKHDEIMNKYGIDIKIVIDGLTEAEAYQKELEVIKLLIDDGYGIDIKGLEGSDPNRFLTNKTFGGKGSIGISNPQYGVSPKDRMSEEVYIEWLRKQQELGKLHRGENNPNWGNDALRKKYAADPELCLSKQSRAGRQNGRCRKVKLFNLDGNYIRTFDYIGECSEYVKEKANAKGRIENIRSNIQLYAKKNKPFLGFRYELL